MKSIKNVLKRYGNALGKEEGQVVVELAVITPVMLGISLVVFNLMAFLEASARFDRLVPNIITAVAISPGGYSESTGADQSQAVAQELIQAMDGLWNVSIEVHTQSSWHSGSSGELPGFSFAPHLTRYVCTMVYSPWPQALTIGFFSTQGPLVLEHTKTFTVDTYKSGVIF